MTSSKTGRWLDLLAFLLQHRYPVTREQIFEQVGGYSSAEAESARRKFERDKDELRALGLVIETVNLPGSASDEPQHGYRLKAANFYLPQLELNSAGAAPAPAYQGLPRLSLTDHEVQILDRATRRLAQRSESPFWQAAASARRKLAFDLPLDDASVEQVLASPMPEASRQALELLQRAVAERRAVSCRYHSMSRDAESRRDIEPWGLFFQRSHWYCVGWAPDRRAIRVFRVDRMRDAALTPGTRPFHIPADFDVRQWMGRAPWEFGDGPATTVEVRFAFPESRWVLNQTVGRVVTPVLEDGGAVVAFETRDRQSLLKWLLSFRRQATVLAPADVAADLETLRQQVAALYRVSHD